MATKTTASELRAAATAAKIAHTAKVAKLFGKLTVTANKA